MESQARMFGALASEHRIGILQLLKEHPQCVNAIVKRLGLTQPAVSQHLRVLKEAGLVKARKTGSWMHYELDAAAIESCGRGLERLFGGWVKPSAGAKGTANCPPILLQECQQRGPARRPRAG
jgi:ArsR family transcriptional regulator, arsenate/arsenite/antimonite-responsive transcriptional repressor